MLKIFNTLGRKKEEFRPLKKKQVSFYQCGPTVYWTQHIGNMRAMVIADLIRRSLEYLGYKVTFARNYTDVGHLTSDEDEGEDKIEIAARRDKLSPRAAADKYIAVFEQDVKDLNCLEPKFKPRATQYIPQMKKMVQQLLDKGFAYSTDLAIYFDVSKAKNYTQLSGQDLSKNISEKGKAEVSDPRKKNPADFALWFFKAGVHKNALQYWPSDFSSPLAKNGEGFPGWHLECSAMNKALFGPALDLHLGGVEHIPVHHTNEIAQSEAASGVKFVNYWIHNEHLNVDNGKMAKSQGTAYSLQEIKDRGFDPLVLRYFFLQAHYRSKQNFTWEALISAQSALAGWREKILADKQQKKGKINRDFKDKFLAALRDDFNLPQALAVAWDLLKSDLAGGDKLATILDFDQVLGLNLNQLKTKEIPKEVLALAESRQIARREKNWSESDRLREEIARLGYKVLDAKDGYQILPR